MILSTLLVLPLGEKIEPKETYNIMKQHPTDYSNGSDMFSSTMLDEIGGVERTSQTPSNVIKLRRCMQTLLFRWIDCIFLQFFYI